MIVSKMAALPLAVAAKMPDDYQRDDVDG